MKNENPTKDLLDLLERVSRIERVLLLALCKAASAPSLVQSVSEGLPARPGRDPAEHTRDVAILQALYKRLEDNATIPAAMESWLAPDADAEEKALIAAQADAKAQVDAKAQASIDAKRVAKQAEIDALGMPAAPVENYGTLRDAFSNENLRPATAAEAQASREASKPGDFGKGTIEVDGRKVYVAPR